MELTTKLISAVRSIAVPVSLANSGGQPRMPLMEIAKRLVKHDPVEDAGTPDEKRAFGAALVTIEEVADRYRDGKSTVEEKTAGGEAETARFVAIYRPG
eukprot:jgi/Tetstr1/442176/TSEL_030327.t1